MKVKATVPSDSFKAVAMEIAFESQAELDAMACHFNFHPTCQFLNKKGVDTDGIFDTLVELGASYNNKWWGYSAAVSKS